MEIASKSDKPDKELKSMWGGAGALLRIIANPFIGCSHDFKKVNGHQMIGEAAVYTYRCPICRKRDFF